MYVVKFDQQMELLNPLAQRSIFFPIFHIVLTQNVAIILKTKREKWQKAYFDGQSSSQHPFPGPNLLHTCSDTRWGNLNWTHQFVLQLSNPIIVSHLCGLFHFSSCIFERFILTVLFVGLRLKSKSGFLHPKI